MSLVIKHSIDEFGGIEGLEKALANRRKGAPFQSWLRRLNHQDQLPRGKFFKNRKPGSTLLLIDEAWSLLK